MAWHLLNLRPRAVPARHAYIRLFPRTSSSANVLKRLSFQAIRSNSTQELRSIATTRWLVRRTPELSCRRIH